MLIQKTHSEYLFYRHTDLLTKARGASSCQTIFSFQAVLEKPKVFGASGWIWTRDRVDWIPASQTWMAPKFSESIVVTARRIFPTVGIDISGKMTTEVEVTVDEKGRILIPKETREKVGLKTGGKVRLKVEKEKLVIMAPISPEEFIKEMEGCIKEGKPSINPLELKKMWEPKK